MKNSKPSLFNNFKKLNKNYLEIYFIESLPVGHYKLPDKTKVSFKRYVGRRDGVTSHAGGPGSRLTYACKVLQLHHLRHSHANPDTKRGYVLIELRNC